MSQRKDSHSLSESMVSQKFYSPKLCSEKLKNKFRFNRNPQIIEQCLQSLDIFKNILMQGEQMKKKTVLDVLNKIKMQSYDKGTILYQKGDIANGIFLVLKGQVTHYLTQIQNNSETDQKQFIQKEIDTYKQGTGFGQSEFVVGKKRQLTAIIHIDDTIIGKLNTESFQQIKTKYKSRIYRLKLEMFAECPLFKQLYKNKLQFIVNHTKPAISTLNQIIVTQGSFAKFLYLIVKGSVVLHKQVKNNQTFHLQKKNPFIYKTHQSQKMVIGVIQEGSFFGDCEFVLGSPFEYSIQCRTEKLDMYICDLRIIASQLSIEQIQLNKDYYTEKKKYYLKKVNRFNQVKEDIQQKIDLNQKIKLNFQQQQIKRKIIRRYVQDKPTFLSKFSPNEIGIMIDRKQARFKTENSQNQKNMIDIFDKKILKNRINTRVSRTIKLNPIQRIRKRQVQHTIACQRQIQQNSQRYKIDNLQSENDKQHLNYCQSGKQLEKSNYINKKYQYEKKKIIIENPKKIQIKLLKDILQKYDKD